MSRKSKHHDKRAGALGAVVASPTQRSPAHCCEKAKSDLFQPLPDYLQDELHDVIAMAQFLGEPLWPYVSKAWMDRRGLQLGRGAFVYYAYSPKRAEARRRHLGLLLRSPEILVAITPAGIIARLEKILASALTPRVTGVKKMTYQEPADDYAMRTRKVVTEAVDHDAALAVVDRYLRIHELIRSTGAAQAETRLLDECTRPEDLPAATLAADGVRREATPARASLNVCASRQADVRRVKPPRVEVSDESSAPVLVDSVR